MDNVFPKTYPRLKKTYPIVSHSFMWIKKQPVWAVIVKTTQLSHSYTRLTVAVVLFKHFY